MSADQLPYLAEIFDDLRKGRHLCHRRGKVFQALRKRRGEYDALFAQLGFKLVHHPRDFFYFHAETTFTNLSQSMAVFMFILIETLADRGEQVEETLMSGRFRFADLPHLKGERYKKLLREIDITTDDSVFRLVKSMERFGFATIADDEEFLFEVPAYRFLDLCTKYVSNQDQEAKQDVDT